MYFFRLFSLSLRLSLFWSYHWKNLCSTSWSNLIKNYSLFCYFSFHQQPWCSASLHLIFTVWLKLSYPLLVEHRHLNTSGISSSPNSFLSLFFNSPLSSQTPPTSKTLSPSTSSTSLIQPYLDHINSSIQPYLNPTTKYFNPDRLNLIIDLHPNPPINPQRTHPMQLCSSTINKQLRALTTIILTDNSPSQIKPTSFFKAKLYLEWKNVMQRDMEALLRNQTWILVPSPKGKNIIGNH